MVAQEAQTFAPLQQGFSALPMQVRRASGAVVGRPVELEAIQQEQKSASAGRLSGVTVEGEPGIGKTRLLLAASEAAADQGFTTIAVAADEEIRGPFLLARSIVGAPEALEVAAGTAAEEPIRRSLEILSGRDDPGLQALPPDQKLLRTLDLATVAIRALAEVKPLALLIDDAQWADDDSLRLLRYLVRASGGSPIFLMLAVRPEELEFVNEAVNLLADMERLGLIRRLKVARFGQVETSEFLKQLLGGKVDPTSAATMHGQAEGVPFIVEELAHATRDAGMLQEIDGTWALAKNAERLVPSAVRTLISRRAARVPDETKQVLAEAAVLGRHFSLKDLEALEAKLGDGPRSPAELEEALAPAVAAGLLMQHPQHAAADYSFAHDQVREFSASVLSPTKRRAIHGAIVALLMEGEPAPESLPLLAYHAKAAGDAPVCVRFSLQAINNALSASAPEEVLRVVDLALPAAPKPEDRVLLLKARDEAYEILRRPQDRLQGLAELAALSEALGDPALESEIQLRRAAALRISDECEQAADIARRLRERAAASGDRAAELAACLELGQDLLRIPIGEGYSVSLHDIDVEAAREAYLRAVELADELEDLSSLAAAERELGVIAFAEVRDYFIERIHAGEQIAMQAQVAAGSTPQDLVSQTPMAPKAMEAMQRLGRSLELYEKIGDRRGAMTAIIGLGYASWGPDIHFGSSAGRHIEEIRRLASRMDTLTKESERHLAEAQMLYGVHVFSRAKIVPDLALFRGEEAYAQAKLIGDRSLEFVSAGGTALAHLDLGELEEAGQWIEKAAAIAAESPTSFRARMLETWKGQLGAASGDAAGARSHLERAAEMATENGLAAARCEAMALLAISMAKLGSASEDKELLDLAEKSANEVKTSIETLSGHPPWGLQADAALAQVALARGDVDAAVTSGRSALVGFEEALQEDAHLEVLLPVSAAFIQGGTEQEAMLARSYLQVTLAMAAQRTMDESVRVRWLRGPLGRELVEMAGPLDGLTMTPGGAEAPIEESDVELLGHMVQGLTNEEIADRLGLPEEEVSKRLAGIFARLGASSRAEATAFAFREQVV
ncbi:MAG: helix-turn-helix transcriptional regulator [Actinomycetota bacterium]